MPSMKILFIDGTAGYYPKRLEEKPTGGILTSLTLIPRYLAAQGFDVSVMSVHNTAETYQGVKHIAHPTDRTDFDVVVFNRNMLSRQLAEQFKNSRKIWWLHDVVDPVYLGDDGFRLMDEIVALSNYCRDSYSYFYDIHPERFTLIPNGVDRDVFFPPQPQQPRRSNLFVCASAPIKGLYPLEYTFNNMKRWDSSIEMRVYSSQRLHELEDSASHKAVLERLAKAGVQIMEPVSQKQLAGVFREATALLMPNSYLEICSNLLLQAQACGLPVVATNIGSAAEFIKDGETGLLTKYGPQDMFLWHKDFAQQCAGIFFDGKLREKISRQAPASVPTWGDIGNRWISLLLKTAVTA